MAVNNRGTEAYDLSLFEPKPPKLVALEPNKKVQKVQKTRSRIQSMLNVAATLAVALVALGIIGTMIGTQVRLTELNAQIVQREQELQVLKTEQVRLTNELSQKTSEQAVEDYASNELGMQKMEPYQIEYITVPDGEAETTEPEEARGVLDQIGGAILDFFTELAYLFE